MLNALPTVVTAPGDYKTRDGRRVTIHNVTPLIDATVTAFRAKGSVWRMCRGKMRPVDHQIWHVSGRTYTDKENVRDIVGPWSEGE